MRRRAWLSCAAATVAALSGCAAPPRGASPAPPPASPAPPAAGAGPAAVPHEDGPAPAASGPSALPLQRPPRLRPGDTVGLFASGTRLTEAWITQALANLQALGLRPRLGRHVRAVQGHYAGSVEQRVDDLHALWADDDVRALWSIRGGAGTAQLLPHLDYAAMRRKPKALVGFSDVSALQLALLRHAGLVSFNGPDGVSTFTPFSMRMLRSVLMQPQSQLRLERSGQHRARAEAEPQFRARSITAGSAEGPLVGGNLSVLSAMVGTPFLPSLDGALLFLEDVGEPPYRVDRMLTQLEQAGLLRGSAALVAGVFDRCEAPPDGPRMPLAEVIDLRLRAAGVPAVYGASFGHVSDQLTLPLGVRARLDAGTMALTLLEPAVD